MSDPTPEELAAANARLRAENRLVAQRAVFDRYNDYEFHDPDATFSLMQAKGVLDGVKVKPNGAVDEVGMRKAVRDFVKQNRYLVDEDLSPRERRKPHGPSGGNVGSGRKRYGPPLLDESTLRKKFPGL